tara:strand:- start:20782 stop:21870 length:1089 start_codon:yes stop_codon:yes gene_type:complete
MKPENIVVALEKFFFEIIGQLLPGFLLLVGLSFLLPDKYVSILTPTSNVGYWAIVGVAYIMGGALTTIGSYAFIPLYLSIVKFPIISWIYSARMKSTLQTNNEIDEKLIVSEPYKIISSKFDEVPKISTIRNIAMSSIAQPDKETTIRFMFLSLLSQGVATGFFILASVYSVKNFIELGISWDTIFGIGTTIAIAFFLVLPFVIREREFYDRARRLPIDSYLAILKSESKIYPEKINIKTVYLSGGHRSGWQEKVKSSVKKFNYLDPSQTGIIDPKLYTEWDLQAIKNSEIIFAYFEGNNPSGYGLSLELGYAAAYGKFIILVDEKSSSTPEISRYIKIVRETANVVFDDLDSAIRYLKNLA